jgi:hypothetical protein
MVAVGGNDVVVGGTGVGNGVSAGAGWVAVTASAWGVSTIVVGSAGSPHAVRDRIKSRKYNHVFFIDTISYGPLTLVRPPLL